MNNLPTDEIAKAASSIDFSLVISLVALVLSVVSPVIASVISGYFHLKEKNLEIEAESKKRRQEFYEEHRAEVIERYIKNVGKACRTNSRDSLVDFGETMGEIYLYVDVDLWPILDSIAKQLTPHSISNPSEELIKLCMELSKKHIRSNGTELDLVSTDKVSGDT